MPEITAPAPPAARPLRVLLGTAAALALDAALLAVGVGGVHALLRHPRAVGLLLVWAAGDGALAGLRARGGRDPARTRPGQLPALAALLILPLVTPMLSAWGERSALWPLPGGAVLRWGGVALAGAGILLRVLAIQRLGPRLSPLVEVQRGHALETGGVYAALRHPGYAGAWVANLGSILAFGSAATLPLAVLLALVLAWRVRVEEREMDAAFGEAWRRYRARTGAFWPRRGR